MSAAPRGRYAPSPTGEIHLGNASTALASWLSVRARGGSFVMRVEDLDRARSREELLQPILDDLRWLGIDWDEGTDVGGPYAPYRQSGRFDSHRVAFERLRGAGLLYPCFCSRKDIAAAASAPQQPGEELRYPGICRALPQEAARERLEREDRHAWRFRVPPDAPTGFDDLVYGRFDVGAEGVGDFVVWRSDDVPSYQLAVVVDDAEMRIDEVVRGDDLLSSGLRQRLLFEALDLPLPAFGHVPLLRGTDGERLSKRHAGTTLRELREVGLPAETIVGRLAHLLGLVDDPAPRTARSLVDGFRLDRIEPRSGGIVVEPLNWR